VEAGASAVGWGGASVEAAGWVGAAVGDGIPSSVEVGWLVGLDWTGAPARVGDGEESGWAKVGVGVLNGSAWLGAGAVVGAGELHPARIKKMQAVKSRQNKDRNDGRVILPPQGSSKYRSNWTIITYYVRIIH